MVLEPYCFLIVGMVTRIYTCDQISQNYTWKRMNRRGRRGRGIEEEGQQGGEGEKRMGGEEECHVNTDKVFPGFDNIVR